MNLDKANFKICVVGLGYVGLPLAARFSLKGFDLVGFDTNKDRVKELQNLYDKNEDVGQESLVVLNKNSKITSNIIDIKNSNVFIVTVPTPLNKDKTPDLKPIKDSSKIIGSIMKKGSVIVYESTVYPGVTDDICTPILEKESQLIFNKEFSTGYSPERIVPGDTINTIEKITKVVSGSNPKTLKIISYLYSSIIDAGIFEATSIKVAEAAKITENIQRDVNIALINEMHQLYTSLDINTHEVIEAASTKWNFMKLMPGMVGGHCISIDPYYLMHKSIMSGYTPNIMSAARKVNDEMHNWVLQDFLKYIQRNKIDIYSISVTVLGYSFKENCSDTRNTKVRDLILLMQNQGIKVKLWDPLISEEDHKDLNMHGIETHVNEPKNIKLAFVCVYHDQVLNFLKDYKGLKYDYRN